MLEHLKIPLLELITKELEMQYSTAISSSFWYNYSININEQEYVKMFSGENKWHRYPTVKDKVFYDVIHKIVDTKFMNGNASRVWSVKPNNHEVVMYFINFKDCGFKFANMAPNLLFRYFGVEFSDYSFIDIVPDVHTMRVFQRFCLIRCVQGPEIARIYTIYRSKRVEFRIPMYC